MRILVTEQPKETGQSAKVGSERDEELANAIDAAELRIVEESEAERRPGNRADRDATQQVESDDLAPE